MTLLLCQAGLNLVKKTSQTDDTVTVSGWNEPDPKDTLSMRQACGNLVQKTSHRDDTVTVSGWFEPRPEDKSKRGHCCYVRLV